MTQANEAAWYNEHYQRNEPLPNWPPWYRFLLPELGRTLTPSSRLVELGCGQGLLLRHLKEKNLLPEENIFGLDQSSVAVDYVRKFLPRAQLAPGDIYNLTYPKNHFEVCLLMETIEHLEDPLSALQQVFSVTAPSGALYVSFPNYLSLPWLPVRLLSEKLKKPSWIGLQPIDKIYTVFDVIRLVSRSGFQFERGIGSGYGPPIFYKWEADWMTRALNSVGLWRLSFHPILVFRKGVPHRPPESAR